MRCLRVSNCFRVALLGAGLALIASQSAVAATGQMGGMDMGGGAKKPMASPPATATVNFGGQQVVIKYNTPSMRGRKIMGGLVPYGQVWRTGANPATTLITPVPLHIGALLVPAGTYTIYSLPDPKEWKLIVNKQTGQWGTEYTQGMDLGRVPMKGKTLDRPQEVMSISFDGTKGNETELHVRWENTDEFVKVTTP
ncbi:DUF2911 domain-containing protein [Granulicella sp. WH15]|uniref:DUF2911 domain-containing protein n=1 Tax=Granulicella sp. WH15 TaxID=2602070 RepID=UPI001366C555|nr:DUF2911 domain-containing protein [Granulicella sp. WH15]QHN04188.1 DUF2911 domain-containing protein [Granulicella sp. WH15]